MPLANWDRVIHKCVGKLTIIGADGRRQAIIWTNAGILLIGTLGKNFSEILIEIKTFSLKKIHLNMSSAKWRPFCKGLNVLISRLAKKEVTPQEKTVCLYIIQNLSNILEVLYNDLSVINGH